MRLQLIHLSDIHFEKKEHPFKIQIDKMMQAINSIEVADECIIVLSGDLAAKGKKIEYRFVSSLLGAIFKNLERNNYQGKKIEFVCVPGNHDINFATLNISFQDIVKAYKEDRIEVLVDTYLNNMNAFFDFARHMKCFLDDNIVSKKVMSFGEKKIGFVMLNTAPLSVLGGNSEDMGNHFLSDEQLIQIEQAMEANINVLVMHHSIEWFQSTCKDRLRKIISKKYSLVITGHEHEPIGESRNINGFGEVQCIQGNALYGYTKDGNGFCTVNIDMQNNKMIAYSFLWNKSIYVPKKILEHKIKTCFGGEMIVNNAFLDEIGKDSYKREIDEYYVFPSLSYNIFKENEEIEKQDIESENELMELISKYQKIEITGDHKAGKTVLAQRLFRQFLSQGKTPILITASDINKKKIEKTIEYAFRDQYDVEDNTYEEYIQMDISKKIVLLDEANLICKNVFDTLLTFLENNFEKVIIFSEEKIDLDIRKQVVSAMVEEDLLHLSIKPFLYVKRKKLISNILSCNEEREYDIEKETNKINNIINMQVKYFHLDPEFIINFVNQYDKDYRFQFSTGMNVFNIVYESSIKNRIIVNANNIDATIVINILREIAYYMHFSKKNVVGIDEITNIIEQYGKEYRQHINVRLFFEAALNAKILVENANEIRFKEHTLVAYFVAQAINQKYFQDEDIKGNLDYLLKNLCFSINSDIVLFLALITNNPKFVNIIIDGAKTHFANQEELSFDRENVKFLLDTSIPIKNTVPNKQERQQREAILAKQEEEVKLSDLVELVNEYDYSEEDLEKVENQIVISFKYLEILSKTLPAFCQNMKAAQQDRLVSLIYKCPNQFLYMLLRDIGENFEEYCNTLYKEVSTLRKEKNIAEVNLDSVKHMIEQVSALLVIAMYQFVASTSATEQSIDALNEFDFNYNANYKLQNFMMLSRIEDVSAFKRRAQRLDKEMENKLEKSIIKFTVREYLLRNNIEIYGEAQSLLDYFFYGQSSKKLKMEIAKRRITGKDRT